MTSRHRTSVVDPEEALSVTFASWLQEGPSSPRLRKVRDARRVLELLRRLPRLPASPSSTIEGQAVRDGLSRTPRLIRTPAHEATSVLVLPEDPAEYSLGAARQTVRRKTRVAERLGVGWRFVTDPDERAALLERADAYERINPDPRYRDASPQNTDLMAIGLWMVATSPTNQPLVLVVIPVDGPWAMLRYFRRLDDTEASSAARYLMTKVLAEELSRRGVRYLADTVSPIRLPNGLRHFQRMVGYRVVRVVLQKPGT